MIWGQISGWEIAVAARGSKPCVVVLRRLKHSCPWLPNNLSNPPSPLPAHLDCSPCWTASSEGLERKTLTGIQYVRACRRLKISFDKCLLWLLAAISTHLVTPRGRQTARRKCLSWTDRTSSQQPVGLLDGGQDLKWDPAHPKPPGYTSLRRGPPEGVFAI